MLIYEARKRLRDLGFDNLIFRDEYDTHGEYGAVWAVATPRFIEDGYQYSVRAWAGRFEMKPPLGLNGCKRLAAERLVKFVKSLLRQGYAGQGLKGEGDG